MSMHNVLSQKENRQTRMHLFLAVKKNRWDNIFKKWQTNFTFKEQVKNRLSFETQFELPSLFLP